MSIHHSSVGPIEVHSAEVGFGLPTLHSLLPIPPGPGLVVIQSWAGSDEAQRFCLEMRLGSVFAWK